MGNQYDVEYIRKLSERALISNDLSSHDAKVLVDSMLAADTGGVSTHGIRMLPAYIDKIRKKEFNLETPKIIRQTSSFTVVDANNTVGAVSGDFGTEIAIENAKISGLHTVFVRHANTYGPAFYYVEKIAKANQIGFTCCNSPAAMPVFNGLEPMLGTNPLAFAAPSKSQGNIVMDMATSIVAKSKIGVALNTGSKLEEGWAIDSEGNPTTEPIEAIKGMILPMAGFKGYGLAMMIDIISGFLSGASFLNNVGKFYSADGKPMDNGQVFIAINPSMIFDGDYLGKMDEYIRHIRNSKRKPDTQIVVPGDRHTSNTKNSIINGIEISDETVIKLEEIFGEQIKAKVLVKNEKN